MPKIMSLKIIRLCVLLKTATYVECKANKYIQVYLEKYVHFNMIKFEKQKYQYFTLFTM